MARARLRRAAAATLAAASVGTLALACNALFGIQERDLIVDAGIDSPVTDVGVDALIVDAGVDSGVRDVGIDVPAIDAASTCWSVQASDASTCDPTAAAPPMTALREVSLGVNGVSFGAGLNGWQTVGFNLDGKCTTETSTDVCTVALGAPLTTQDDGVSGIDNGFGSSLCPLIQTIGGGLDCNTNISGGNIRTDSSGTGVLVLYGFAPFGSSPLVLTLRDAYVYLCGNGAGVLGGVLPAAELIASVQATASNANPAMWCAPQPFGAIAMQLAQAPDILMDGGNAAGVPCDSISVGMSFSSSSTFDGVLPIVNNVCPDAGDGGEEGGPADAQGD